MGKGYLFPLTGSISTTEDSCALPPTVGRKKGHQTSSSDMKNVCTDDQHNRPLVAGDLGEIFSFSCDAITRQDTHPMGEAVGIHKSHLYRWKPSVIGHWYILLGPWYTRLRGREGVGSLFFARFPAETPGRVSILTRNSVLHQCI